MKCLVISYGDTYMPTLVGLVAIQTTYKPHIAVFVHAHLVYRADTLVAACPFGYRGRSLVRSTGLRKTVLSQCLLCFVLGFLVLSGKFHYYTVSGYQIFVLVQT